MYKRRKLLQGLLQLQKAMQIDAFYSIDWGISNGRLLLRGAAVYYNTMGYEGKRLCGGEKCTGVFLREFL